MGKIVVSLAALQAALVILTAIIMVAGGEASTGPERVYLAVSLLFAAPPVAAAVLSRKVTRAARPRRGIVQLALLAVVIATIGGYFAYGRPPSPGGRYGMYGELKSGGPVFGVSVGMSHEDAAQALKAGGRFHHVDSACLAPGTFEVAFSGAPPHPTERDCKGAGLEDLWEADPLYFGEAQMVSLHIRQGKVVHMEWRGGGNIIG